MLTALFNKRRIRDTLWKVMYLIQNILQGIFIYEGYAGKLSVKRKSLDLCLPFLSPLCSLRCSEVAIPFQNGRFPKQNGRSFQLISSRLPCIDFNRIMLGGSFHDGVRRYFIVQDHRFPVVWIALRTHDSAFSLFIPLFKKLKEYLDFTFVCDRVEQKVIQYDQFPFEIPGVVTNFASLGWQRIHKRKLIKIPYGLDDTTASYFSLGAQTAAGMIRRSGILVRNKLMVEGICIIIGFAV